MPKKSRLTPKQQRFVDEYLCDLNATQAAIRAGYSRVTADRQGPRLLGNVVVSAEIAERRKAISEKLKVTPERIMAELAKLAFSNMRTSSKPAPTGRSSPGTRWRRLQKFTSRNGRRAPERPLLSSGWQSNKLADKRAALVDLGRFLGIDKTPFKQPEPAGDEHQAVSSNPELSKVIELFRKQRAR